MVGVAFGWLSGDIRPAFGKGVTVGEGIMVAAMDSGTSGELWISQGEARRKPR
jgi:hypothetical protein